MKTLILLALAFFGFISGSCKSKTSESANSSNLKSNVVRDDTVVAPLPTVINDTSLSASIDNAKFEEKNSSISLDFVIKNNSNKTIAIAERWNSWGAFQWTVYVTTADHRMIEFKNPQAQWKRNFLSTVDIEPGKEFRLHCRLFANGSAIYEGGFEVFESKINRLNLTFPIHIVGIFSAKLESQGKVTTNWEGTIKTPKFELKQ